MGFSSSVVVWHRCLAEVSNIVIARSKATKQSIVSWVDTSIASRSLSSGARSRDPLARNDQAQTHLCLISACDVRLSSIREKHDAYSDCRHRRRRRRLWGGAGESRGGC